MSGLPSSSLQPDTKSEESKDQTPLILIVDDDRRLQMMLKVAIEQEGFSVVQAGSGEQCLQDYQRLQPDMVLIDAMMPGIDGFECCRQIRQMPHAAQVPILMITVLDQPEFVERAFQSGASDYVTKPISWAVLSHRVRYLLERYQGIRQAEVIQSSLVRYLSWKESQRQLRNMKSAQDSTAQLLAVLQGLNRFVSASRTLLYQVTSQQWLEASVHTSAQMSHPLSIKLSALSIDWLNVLQSRCLTSHSEPFPIPFIQRNDQDETLKDETLKDETLKSAFQTLCDQLDVLTIWPCPTVVEGELRAVLLVCFSQAEPQLLTLEKEAIRETAEYMTYALKQ